MAQTLLQLFSEHEDAIVADYTAAIRASSGHYSTVSTDELEGNIRRSLSLVVALSENPGDVEARDYVHGLCRLRVPQGFRLEEVMEAIFLLGESVVPIMRRVWAGDDTTRQAAADQLRRGLQRLATLWAGGYWAMQEDLMARKEAAMRRLSTPVISIWEGILTLPLIGDVDDGRSRQVTEELLSNIVATQSDFVLLDITGLGSINTAVIAQLMRTIRAAELLGAQCWIVGVSPEVAQTIVHLGVDMQPITTYATLREGLAEAMRRLGLRVVDERAR
ncbi:MAG: STAS domain-containing protein [Fimbriimonadaceae bacterium]|nr:STAS domain-containing protein [Fimbriimonadaceae bacterium]